MDLNRSTVAGKELRGRGFVLRRHLRHLTAEAMDVVQDPVAPVRRGDQARGLGLSSFVGYKWTHHSGFTFDGQVGAAWIAAGASSSTASVNKSAIGAPQPRCWLETAIRDGPDIEVRDG